jgi:hypothetical protein
MSGLLLMAAVGGAALAVWAMRRGHGPNVPAGERTIESRLREIDDLRERALISDAEQQEARRRVLSQV